ncbi:MAG: sodium:proton antiporter [Clostridiales bacterium]|nr:sodium:proton antiporter [Clostridiales bacterium]
MPETISYQSILIISLLAFVTPVIINSIKKIKIPYVVGEIIVGLIVGKSFLNVVHEDSWVIFLSNLGLAYLMYLSGLEIDFSQFQSKDNKKNLLICVFMFLSSLVISYGISLILFHFGLIQNVLFFAFLLSATAPGLLVPFFKERNLSDTSFGQTLLIFSLMGEFSCLIAITFVSSSISDGISYKSFLFMIVIAAAVLLYSMARRITKKYQFSAESFSGLHMEVRASFAVILILVAVSQAVGTEIVFGSFIAGVIFSVISGMGREDLKNKVDIIGYGFLVPIFFIEIGVNINIKEVFQSPVALLMLPMILLIFFLVKLVPSLLLSYLFGIKKALPSSFLLSAQLSLMIVGLQIARALNIISEVNYSLAVFATIISCLLFPVLFDKTFSDEGLVRKRQPAVDKICIRETVLTNAALFDKPLKKVKFPSGCRIFMIVRDGNELLPTGATVLKQGDILLMAGMKTNEEKMIGLISTGEAEPAE